MQHDTKLIIKAWLLIAACFLAVALIWPWIMQAFAVYIDWVLGF